MTSFLPHVFIHSFLHWVYYMPGTSQRKTVPVSKVKMLNGLRKWIFVDMQMEIRAYISLASLVNVIIVHLRIIKKGSCKIT